MASVSTSGLDELISRLGAIDSKLKAGILDAAILEGAEKAEEIWKHHAEKHRLSGDMIEGITHTHITEGKSSRACYVYPQGTDRRGVSNAQKAYVINYSRPGDSWAEEADKEATEKGNQAVADALVRLLDDNGF